MREELRGRIAEGAVIVVAGAGVSTAITDGAAPDWRTLINKGVSRCVALHRAPSGWAARMCASLADGDVIEKLAVAEQVACRLGWDRERDRCDGEWRAWLLNTIGVLTIPDDRRDSASREPLVRAMRTLGRIATLNYDDLIHLELGVDRLTWKSAADWLGVIMGGKDCVLHLHGHWREPESIVFGILGYTELLRHSLSQHLQHVLATTHSLLFVGCGDTFDDPNFQQFVDWMANVLGSAPTRHYVLVRDGEAENARQRFPRGAHINVLPYGKDHDHLLRYLKGLAPVRSALSPGATASVEKTWAPDVIGRDGEIAELTRWILADDPPPIAILGASGCGLSTIPRAAFAAPDIVSRFGERRKFVHCEMLSSADALRAECALTNADLEAVGSGSRLLILDNLEIAWLADRENVEAVLRELLDEPGAVIVAILRGREMPRLRRDWHRIKVPPLDPASSRTLFLRRTDSRFANDPMLDQLIEEVTSGLPLAVVLLAHAALDDANLEVTSQRWRRERTKMLARPAAEGRRASLSVSLELSISSPRTTDNARRLLALLAFLPAGLHLVDLERLSPVDGRPAMDCLVKSGLAGIDADSGRLTLLGPVGEYVKEAYPPEDHDLGGAIGHYAAVAKERGGRVSPSPDDADHQWLVSGALVPRSGWVDGSISAMDQRVVAAAQAQGVNSGRRRLGQLLTSLVSTSVR